MIQTSAPEAWRCPKILVIDDRADIRFSLAMLLEDNNFEVIQADNPKAAHSAIVENAVSLILLACAYGLGDLLEGFIGWQLLLNLTAALTLIGAIAFFACYMPLREYINRPAVNRLRGSE